MKQNHLVRRVIAVILLAFVSYSCQDEGFTGGAQSDGAGGGLFFDTGGIRQPPVISSVVPNTGPVGETIVINGSYFSGTLANNTVSFNGTPAVITEASPSRLVITVPFGATSGIVTVTSDGFVAQTNNSFQVIAPNTWQFRVAFPGSVERTSGVAFTINGKGYMGTGFQSSGLYRKDFWEYDPITNTLTQKADFAGGRRMGAVGFTIGFKGYVGTGVNDDSSGDKSDFYEYDPNINTWEPKSPFPGTPRHLAGGFSVGNKGYIVAGTHAGTHLKDLWEYNRDTNVWFGRAELPGTARYKPVAFAVGARAFVGGGNNTFKDFWRYTPQINTWVQMADIPGSTPTVGFGANSNGYVGMASSGAFWKYNVSSNTWQLKAAYPGNRYGGSAFVIGNWGYFAFGRDDDDNSPYGAYIHRYVAE